MNRNCGRGYGVFFGRGTGEWQDTKSFFFFFSSSVLFVNRMVTNKHRQMSTLLSRPLLIDQDDHELQIPDGRLENMTDPEAPHPLSAVALQAELGLYVSHLFQKLGNDSSVKLTLEIEDALEKWMGTFPAALRDHRPDTRWDQKYPNIPFMRCQLNVIAYCYLLGPLKPYLLGTADPAVLATKLGQDLRVKGVDTCLDLMSASEKFYDLIFPASIKYFFIIFFMFDAATVMCSAVVHDADRSLPKRPQCVRALRTAQELMDGVAHLSESARLSAQLLRKLTASLPLTPAEKQTLGVGLRPSRSPSPPSSYKKKARIGSDDVSSSSAAVDVGVAGIGGANSNHMFGGKQQYEFDGGGGVGHQVPPPPIVGGGGAAMANALPASVRAAAAAAAMSYNNIQQQPPPSYAVATAGQQPLYSHPTAAAAGGLPMQQQQWPVMSYGPSHSSSSMPGPTAASTTGPHSHPHQQPPPSTTSMLGGGGGGPGLAAAAPGHPVGVHVSSINMQPGDPLTGTFLEPLWDWEHLNMDLSAYSMPHYGGL